MVCRVDDVTAVLLCGGKSQRMCGVDKPLLHDDEGAAIVDHLIEAVAPQVDDIIISANRSIATYRRRGYRVVSDAVPDGGPLAGVYTAATACRTKWLFICPGDSPNITPSIVLDLFEGCDGADAIYIQSEGEAHYLNMLVKTEVALTLGAWLLDGQRAVHAWLSTVESRALFVPDHELRFFNINTADEYRRWIQHTRGQRRNLLPE